MIPRLQSSVSFKANELTSARDAYSARIDKNNQTAQKQNGMIPGIANSLNAQIPMNGAMQAKKLDVIA